MSDEENIGNEEENGEQGTVEVAENGGDSGETDGGEVTTETIGEATTKTTEEVKKGAMAAFDVLAFFGKILWKIFKKAPVIAIVIFVLFMILVFFKSRFWEDKEIGHFDNDRKDLIADVNVDLTDARTDRMSDYAELLNVAKEYAKYDDIYFEEFKNAMQDYHTVLMNNSKQINEVSSLNLKGAGYQVVDHDRVLLTYLERLSYAFTRPEWDPDRLYDPDRKVENGVLKPGKYHEKYNYLNNEFFKKKYTSQTHYMFPDGTVIPQKKGEKSLDSYGNRVVEAKEDNLNLYHTILNRIRTYGDSIPETPIVVKPGESFEGPLYKRLGEWLDDPTLKSKLNDEIYKVEDLQEFEKEYRLKYEEMHNDVFIRRGNDVTINDIFSKDLAAKATNISALEEIVSSFMPSFEYVTAEAIYSSKVFNSDRVYDEVFYDEADNYKVPEYFKSFLEKYSEGDYDVDYNPIVKMEILGMQRDQFVLRDGMKLKNDYEELINTDEDTRNQLLQQFQDDPEKLDKALEEAYKYLINGEIPKSFEVIEVEDQMHTLYQEYSGKTYYEVEEEINLAKSELNNELDFKLNEFYLTKMKETYNEKNERLEKVVLNMNPDENPYNAHNHKVTENKDYYFDRYKEEIRENTRRLYVDSYTETLSVSIGETVVININEDGTAQDPITTFSGSTGLNVVNESYNIKPLRLQSILKAEKYNYIKEEKTYSVGVIESKMFEELYKLPYSIQYIYKVIKKPINIESEEESSSADSVDNTDSTEQSSSSDETKTFASEDEYNVYKADMDKRNEENKAKAENASDSEDTGESATNEELMEEELRLVQIILSRGHSIEFYNIGKVNPTIDTVVDESTEINLEETYINPKSNIEGNEYSVMGGFGQYKELEEADEKNEVEDNNDGK